VNSIACPIDQYIYDVRVESFVALFRLTETCATSEGWHTLLS
jgi:hypothetical protein